MNIELPAFETSSVLVIGDVMLDRYWYGATTRISQEAPVPIIGVDNCEDRFGGAANVALNIMMLGGAAKVAGILGPDEAGNILKNKLIDLNIGQCLHISKHPTITKLRVISRGQQLIRLDFEEHFDIEDSDKLKDKITSELSEPIIILSDYAKGSLQHNQEIIKAASAKNIKVLVDPKGQDFIRYKGAYLLTPNLHEFEAVVGSIKSEADIEIKGFALLDKLELSALLITRSEHGMTLLTKDREVWHLPTVAKDVCDVTGAGDTVIATLATALGAGASLYDSCLLANIAAGIVVSKLGTSTVSREELIEKLEIHDKASGIMNQEQLESTLLKLKSMGKKVVMTNGCFDILHAGHVKYLNEAADQGDILIVAVNDDDSVKRLKGSSRPVNSLDKRMAVLGALKSVDFVVSFSEDTPLNLINKLMPDVLVKGGDYKIESIVGSKEVLAHGGCVKVLSFADGISTTAIITKLMIGH